jgi:hypothetical protein
MNELVGLVILAGLVAAFALLAGGGRSPSELRLRRRWDAAFESELRRVRPSDATGVLRCRSCGQSGSERAGRCPGCGAVL